jgi:hypothetical protein
VEEGRYHSRVANSLGPDQLQSVILKLNFDPPIKGVPHDGIPALLLSEKKPEIRSTTLPDKRNPLGERDGWGSEKPRKDWSAGFWVTSRMKTNKGANPVQAQAGF